MQLPPGLLSNISLRSRQLRRYVKKLELVAISFTAADILKALHQEHVLCSAQAVGLGEPGSRYLFNNDTSWDFTDSAAEGWRLLTCLHTEFLLMPACMELRVLEGILHALGNRLPYLHIQKDEYDGVMDDHERRGRYITAMALLQGLLPEDI